MTTLLEHLTPIDLTGIKTYLKITGVGEDSNLTLWYSAGIFRCNEKLSRRDFTEADGFPGSVPPDDVVLGVYKFVKAEREHYEQQHGVKRNKTGARETEYADVATSPGGSIGLAAAWEHLETYCNPLHFASLGGW